jgi:hypothetical protein
MMQRKKKISSEAFIMHDDVKNKGVQSKQESDQPINGSGDITLLIKKRNAF